MDWIITDRDWCGRRILIFQHQWLIHSGEEVTKGEKYTVRTDFMYEEAPELDEEE